MKHFLYWTAAILTAGLLNGCKPQNTDSLHAGTVVRDTICDVPCCVYLPADYPSPEHSPLYPVLYLHHGMYGIEEDWTAKGRLVEIMDSLLRAGQVKEMVVIMPDNCPHRPTADEERANAMNGEWERRFEAFMAEAEAKYRISNDPSLRAIAGLSMGGFHTLHVSHHLHGQFAYVGLFSAAILPTAPNEMYYNWENEVREQIQTTTLYWIGIGKEDFLYDFNVQYRRWLETNHLEYTYYESAGGHTWDNWQDYLCRFLTKIFKS
ncbi:MAG: hypothetical protein IJ814_04675 [Paludibacteraceae bacterium]|nr:hypothetical protein [Paludibacteraceae bacterium]